MTAGVPTDPCRSWAAPASRLNWLVSACELRVAKRRKSCLDIV
uniref:Uncharacterized protein n=1 Tax=Arundo donax TaxID=35708 RepID=A0A0A9E7I5_ARUDO